MGSYRSGSLRTSGAERLSEEDDLTLARERELAGREDDQPETVRERLRVYHRQTEPLVAYDSERRLLGRVDGARDAHAVQAGVRAALE
jgi:adenylate kinase